jgi:hypothetical protein
MLTLHKTETEIYEGVSPAMAARLSFIQETQEKIEKFRGQSIGPRTS